MSSYETILVAFCACFATFHWSSVGAANILAIQPLPGKSHWNVMRAVLRAFTDRGHNVTVFTPFIDGDRDGYTEVDISEQIKPVLGIDANYMIKNFGSMHNGMPHMLKHTRLNCDMIYGHRRMVDILERSGTREFDLVVTEPLVSECVAYVATVLCVPMIYVVPFPVVTYLERSLTGHIINPATVGHIMSRHGTPKTFAERLGNVVVTVHCSILMWYTEWQQRWAHLRPYDTVDLIKPSVIFINSYFITESARPLTPEVVQIGGIHLAPPEPLPKEILEFIDDAPHGVICLSFGSVVLMSSLPETVQRAFRNALDKVPQKVLWKYEGEMKDKPKNVMTLKWFPQRHILLHPNVKLFISHGGISGVYESVDAGVPILGFSFFNDQPRNIDNLVDAGMAISMDILSVTEDKLLNAILEIVNNDRYKKNAKIASQRFKDRPMSPADSAVYWAEYVLRHNGAPHLKSQALNLTWYQYFLLDVISTFLFITFIILFIIFYILKFICNYFYTFFHDVKHKRE
ncbi:UDP-glucuronosyltransferase 2C1-like [Melanaphis sacchari]|uniref:UDP-glucuronosyltransferase 2B17 n=1 Tax=Melanaphis sacchari TaxID=742174 RepID=A0A2H8TLM2_9HEMI|nr:UDP-glucuronosyltransferase 2C1-like [Melanaphis sacchari]XP_025203095.1 UDP-glucuronosyltransferase 2C1-like [Melanaphis sacchari]XP_025203096.1 UDP-glucuronosyltransferase 2C1-like [Melanaphis sacchari]XP_025203097.1 UDP-glucuronosyltransferase 2C1-like [Melanaphis sacchari]